jgi:hypothetical protein
LAHRLAEKLTEVRKNGTIGYLRPDGKTQVTIEYDENNKPVRLDTIVISSQHATDVDLEKQLAPDIKKHVVEPVLKALDVQLDTNNFKLLVNPTGRFEIGGPMGDAGLTGRKIIVDTYGGMSRHGGGAFSGKDPSKVDPKKATTDVNNTSDLDAETKKFAPIINGLNQEFNPNEEVALIPEADQLINPNPFFKNPALDETGAVVSNQTVETVVNGMKGKFTQFISKGTYANQPLYEAKVDGVVRYMSFVQADNINGQAVLIFLWKKSPI